MLTVVGPRGTGHHAFAAIAQKSFDLSTIRAYAKPAAASDSATPSFWNRGLSIDPDMVRSASHRCIAQV
jgi:hypothetical protein